MSVDSDTIAGYFKRIEWIHRVVSPTRIITKYRCPVPKYYYVIVIEVVTGKHWMNVRGLLQRGVRRTHYEAVLQLISMWNQNSYRVRFLLVDDCVILQTEVPAAEVDFHTFLDSLAAVCRYAELAGVEISTLATNQSLVGQFTDVLESLRPITWGEVAPHEDLEADFEILTNRLPD